MFSSRGLTLYQIGVALNVTMYEYYLSDFFLSFVFEKEPHYSYIDKILQTKKLFHRVTQ